jgi:antirestriction protein ArdC
MKINSKRLEKTAQKFTALMIGRITEASRDWTKPWLAVKRKDYLPRNVTGRFYSGGNTLMLLIYSMYYDFRTPVFLTFLQASNLGIRINKGAQSFPVYHIAWMYYNARLQERISIEKYEQLPETGKEGYHRIMTPKCYDVFNLDQTGYHEKYPQEWAELLCRHELSPEDKHRGNYTNGLLDTVIAGRTWVCPIHERLSNRAYYSPAEDKIVLPYRTQFPDAKAFYGTALHEMSHSTGHESRLNRIKRGAAKGTDDYSKEELVAELSSALMGYYLGMETTIREDHACYLRYWLEALEKDHGFLMDVLGDVVQSVKYMCVQLEFNPFGESVQPQPDTVTAKHHKEEVFKDELAIVD